MPLNNSPRTERSIPPWVSFLRWKITGLPMRSKPKKEFAAKRKFNLRRDASVSTGQKKIEAVFGLPTGSVRLHLPKGRRARGDKSIRRLLADWGW